MLRRRGGVFERLLHMDEQPVLVRFAEGSAGRVHFAAHAASRETACYGIQRMRFALGVDEDLRPFLRAHARDPMIGARCGAVPGCAWAVVRSPLRHWSFAICEQLIEYERAAAIQRRLLAALGRGWTPAEAHTAALRDMPATSRAGGHRAGATAVLRLGWRARSRSYAPRARWRAGVSICTPLSRGGLAAVARDPGHRRLDGRDARTAWTGPRRSAPGGRPRAAQARWSASQRRRPQGDCRGARGARAFSPYAPWAALAAAHMDAI